MKIKIVCIGKLKEKYLTEAVKEYLKRLSKYCDPKIIELSEVRLSENSSSGIALLVEKESNKILTKLDAKDFNILLSLKGESISSPQLADLLKEKMIKGYSTFTFIIGGSYGTNQVLDEYVDFKLSLSQLTFTHQMTRVIILEQIYRGFKINNNETYHK